MIGATFDGTDTRTIAEFLQKGPRVIDALISELGAQSSGLAAHIVRGTLPAVLRSRSGKTAASIRPIPVTLRGGRLSAGVQGGTGAGYLKVHEFGGVFTYLRENRERGFGTQVTASYPERRPMRQGLENMRGTITAGLIQAAKEAVK